MATTLEIKLDSKFKRQADSLFKNLGLDTNTAVKIFLAQALRESAIPFKVTQKIDSKKIESKDSKSKDSNAKAKKKRDYDAEFYNPTNVRILKERYDALMAGKGIVKELIDV